MSDIKRGSVYYGVEFRIEQQSLSLLEQLDRRIEQYEKALEKAHNAPPIKAPVKPEVPKDIDEARLKLEGFQAAIRETDAEIRRGDVGYQQGAQRLRELTQELLEERNALQANTRIRGQYNAQISRSSSMIDRLEGNVNRLSFAYQLQQGMIMRSAGSFSALGAAGSFAGDAIGIAAAGAATLNPLLTAGAVAVSALTAGMISLGRRGVPELYAIENANVVLRQNGENVEEVTSKTREFRVELGVIGRQFTESELTSNIAELTKAGLSAAESLDVMSGSTRIAVAEGKDLGIISELMLTNLRQFNL